MKNLNKPFYYILLAAMVGVNVVAKAQMPSWTDISARDKIDVLLKAQDIFAMLQERRINELSFEMHDEVNLGDKWWTNGRSGLSILKKISEQKELQAPVFNTYNFEDLERNPTVKNQALNLRHALDNHSILVSVDYDKADSDEKENALLLFRKNSSDLWKIFGFYGFGTKVKINNPEQLDWKSFKKEKFRKSKFSLWMYSDFKKDKSHSSGDDRLYTLGTDEHDLAHLSVLTNEDINVELNIATYLQAQRLATDIARSDFIIRYMPRGYLFEYELIHNGGGISKVLLTAFYHHDRLVILSLICDRHVYAQKYQEFVATFDNIIFR